MIVLILLLLAAPLHAATYAVSPTGNDSANCTESAPCKSFTTVLPLLRPGDILLLQTGTYTQNLKIGNPPVTSGTPEQRITIRGLPGAIIKPSGVEASTVNGNTQYWVLEDLEFDCSNLSSSTSTVNCISINWRSGPMDSPQATSFITLRRIKFLNTSNPTGTNSIGLGIGSNDNTIEDITIDGTHLHVGDKQGSHGIYLTGSRNKLIRGIVRNAGGCGVQLNDSGDNPNGNRDNSVIGMLIENNGNRASGGGQCGLTVYHNLQNTRVLGNTIINNRGAGMLHEGRNNIGSIIVHNTVANNTSYCFTGGYDSGHPSTAVTFQNNICSNNTYGLRYGAYAGDGSVVANILNDKTPPENSAGNTEAHANLVGVDPQFVSNTDFRLQPQSPACNSGEPITNITRDKTGRGTGRVPDRGAYPCNGSIPEPPQPPAVHALTCNGILGAFGKIVMNCIPQ